MQITINCAECAAGQVLPLAQTSHSLGWDCHIVSNSDKQIPRLPVATEILTENKNNLDKNSYSPDILFQVVAHAWIPARGPEPAQFCPFLKAMRNIPDALIECTTQKPGYSLASITLSDKGAQGLRQDTAGPLIVQMIIQSMDVKFSQHFIIADEADFLRPLLTSLALDDRYNLICTTGGTGLAERDITPQTTAMVLDYALPGFSQAMMVASLSITPNAAISRAIAGVIGKCLVINLPGSKKAVKENLEAILPALSHALAKLNGDISDCGGQI